MLNKKQLFLNRLNKSNNQLSYVGILCSTIIAIYISSMVTGQHVWALLNVNKVLILPLLLFLASLFMDFLQNVYEYVALSIILEMDKKNQNFNSFQIDYINEDSKCVKKVFNVSHILFFYPKIIFNIIGFFSMMFSLMDNLVTFRYI